jgi:hypothetical protein
MKPVKSAELKNRLSHYRRRVRRGEAILIADRDRSWCVRSRLRELEVAGASTGAGAPRSRESPADGELLQRPRRDCLRGRFRGIIAGWRRRPMKAC